MPGPMGGRPNRNQSGPVEKGSIKSLGKLVKFCKPFYFAILVAIVFAIGGAVCTIVGPTYISDLMDVITAGITTSVDMVEFQRIAITLVIIYAVSAVLSGTQHFIMNTVTQKTSKNLRESISKKINKIPLAYFDRTTKGDILSRVTNDVDTIGQALSSAISNLVSAVTMFIGVIVMMFVTNWILALVTIGASLIGFLLMSLILGRSQKYFNMKQEYLGVMDGQIEEVYTNHNVVKSYNGVKSECEKFNDTNEKLYTSNWRSQFLSGMMQPIMSFAGNFSYLMVFGVGIALAINDMGVTFGTIISFVIYARLFSQPLTTFAQSMTYLQQAGAASKRVFDLLEEKEMSDESGKTQKITEVTGYVNFSHVNFGYTEDKTIIHDLNADIKAGQKVAIVGPTGAGKTTLVNLLMRFYELNGGDITIDGVSTKNITRENVHDLFDMILQDTWLFNGTIRENLVYNKQGVTDEQLDRACEAVGLKHYISTLPQGYDTKLDDNVSLSEGQKQQMTIARAMIKDSPLLILDEATSNVDTRTELIIQKAMDELTEGRTSFVIAHRLSTIKNADVIFVVNEGNIVEMGTHKELLAKNGFYAELYNSQFESFAS